ncbi:hypothetical protein D6779_07450, partial [Candidatus Parcubacteria bacterium]
MNKRILAGILISLGLLLAACAKGDNENIPVPATAHVDTSPTGTETPVPTPTRTQLPPTPTPTDVPIVNIVIDGVCSSDEYPGLYPINALEVGRGVGVSGFKYIDRINVSAAISPFGNLAICMTNPGGFRGIQSLTISGKQVERIISWPLGIRAFIDENGQVIPGSLVYDKNTDTLEFAINVSDLIPDYGEEDLSLGQVIVAIDPLKLVGIGGATSFLEKKAKIEPEEGASVPGTNSLVDIRTEENAAIMSQHDLAVNFELSDG